MIAPRLQASRPRLGRPSHHTASSGRSARLTPASRPRDRATRLDRLVVLVLEDHADSRELLRLMLEPLGARVLLAEHGRAGLRILREETPHVILCDG